MDDPIAAVTALRASSGVDHRDVTTEISAETWPDAPADGWVGVGGVVLSPAHDRVVLVRNHWSGDQWVFPGGGVEPVDRSIREALRREVHEETGLEISVERPLLVESQTYVHEDEPARSFEGWFALFQATAQGTDLADDPGATDEEIREVRWFEEVPTAMLEHADRVETVLDDVRGAEAAET